MLRSSVRHSRAGTGRRDATILDNASDWLTLREASEATGVPTDTIRKWARHENIPSFLEKISDGYLRVVSMSGIERWADEIGRDLESMADEPTTETPPAPEPHVDLTEADGGEEAPTVPEGSMIVPLDAWNRMLNQLGNLHEAGQQLAEARERAAKAETEARFLKERLADLRKELEGATEPEPAPEAQPDPTPPNSLIRRAYRGWRAIRRDRR